MGKGLKIAAPPPRPAAPPEVAPTTDAPAAPAAPPTKRSPRGGGRFDQVREGEMVQFNKRIPQAVTGITPDRVTTDGHDSYPPRDPHHAGQRRAAPDQSLPEQQVG